MLTISMLSRLEPLPLLGTRAPLDSRAPLPTLESPSGLWREIKKRGGNFKPIHLSSRRLNSEAKCPSTREYEVRPGDIIVEVVAVKTRREKKNRSTS